MVKVSVVIPVYNVEDYLRDCLDSVVNQTLTDLEIICINDGSPDNSLEILREYEEKDDRITVYDQENGGHAVATNRGIELATGDYLYLMDSDDIVELNALELAYNRAEEKDVDFVIFKAINYDYPNDRYYETEVYSMTKIHDRVGDDVFDHTDIGNLMFEASVTPWSKLYKRDFIIDNNIRFPEGLIFEDNVFFYRALFSAKRICFLDEFLFIRRWYATSSTKAGDLRFLNSIDVMNLIFDVFKEFGQYDYYKTELFNMKFRTAYMRYGKIKEEYKETFFQAMKQDFIDNIYTDPLTYRDFMNFAGYRYKKIFEQTIVSDTRCEFDTLRDVYDSEMQTADEKRHVLVEILSREFRNLTDINEKYQPVYFKNLKDSLIDLLMDKELYDDFLTHISYKNKKKVERILIVDNYEQWKLLKDVYDTQMTINHITKEKDRLTWETDRQAERIEALREELEETQAETKKLEEKIEERKQKELERQKRIEEQKRKEEEQRRKEEEQRRLEEERKEEQRRLEEERKKQQRILEEQRKEQYRILVEHHRKLEEEQLNLEDEQRKIKEAIRIKENQRIQNKMRNFVRDFVE